MFFVLCVLPASSVSAEDAKAPQGPFVIQPPKSEPFSASDPAVKYIGHITQDGGKWNLRLQTRDEYRCSNAEINAVSVVKGDRVSINIDKRNPIKQPSLCIFSDQPATFVVSLPAFDKPLTLDIRDGNNQDRYKITLDTSGSSVNTVRAGFTFFLQDDGQ